MLVVLFHWNVEQIYTFNGIYKIRKDSCIMICSDYTAPLNLSSCKSQGVPLFNSIFTIF